MLWDALYDRNGGWSGVEWSVVLCYRRDERWYLARLPLYELRVECCVVLSERCEGRRYLARLPLYELLRVRCKEICFSCPCANLTIVSRGSCWAWLWRKHCVCFITDILLHWSRMWVDVTGKSCYTFKDVRDALLIIAIVITNTKGIHSLIKLSPWQVLLRWSEME